MTNKEVIEVLALARVGKGTEGKLYDSLAHAIKCVELQIPKKPKQQKWNPALCPNCETSLSEHKGDGYYHDLTHVILCDCGQKLKWEDDDEE